MVANGNVKLDLKYWDGQEIKKVRLDPGVQMDIRGRSNIALRGLKEMPSLASVGQLLDHQFGIAGTFDLQKSPPGATLSSNGELKWTPQLDQVGTQTFEYTITVDGKRIARVARVEVVPASVAGEVGGARPICRRE